MKDVQKSLETSSLVTRPSTASSQSTITNEDINIQKNDVEEINKNDSFLGFLMSNFQLYIKVSLKIH